MSKLFSAGILSLVTLTAHAADVPPEGKRIFDQWCWSCHGPGPDKPGTLGLDAKYGGTLPALLEERRDLNPALVKYFVRNGIYMMAPFRKTEITDAQLEALAAYLSRPKP
jgi:mono/diheme cytochrome c family protein